MIKLVSYKVRKFMNYNLIYAMNQSWSFSQLCTRVEEVVIAVFADGVSRPAVFLLRQQFFRALWKLVWRCAVIVRRRRISVVQCYMCGDVDFRCVWLSVSARKKDAAVFGLCNDTGQCLTSACTEQHHRLFSCSRLTRCSWYGSL